MMKIKLITKAEERIRLLTLSGDIDLAVVHKLREKFEDLISTDKRPLVVSFEHVNYIDSSGIGFMIYMLKITKRENISLVYTQISAPVLQLIQLTKLENYFPLAESIESAIKTLTVKGVA